MNLNIVKSLLLITLFIVLVSSLSADCKLMALIGLNGGELSNSNSGAWYYFANPCLDKLRSMGTNSQYYPNNNPDGWGLLTYDDSITEVGRVWRGEG